MAIFLFFWAVLPKATTRHPAGPVVFPTFLALGGVPLLSSLLIFFFFDLYFLCSTRLNF